jgi:hypothetical protein
MPTAQDLMGHGMSFGEAGELGNDPSSINGAGTTQTGATVIPENCRCILVNGQSAQTAVVLPKAAKIGTPVYVAGTGASAPIVYCPAGMTMNGVSNGGITLSAATATGIFVLMALNKWVCFPLAP